MSSPVEVWRLTCFYGFTRGFPLSPEVSRKRLGKNPHPQVSLARAVYEMRNAPQKPVDNSKEESLNSSSPPRSR